MLLKMQDICLFIISIKSPHKTLKRYNAVNIITKKKNISLGYIRNILNPGHFLTKISDMRFVAVISKYSLVSHASLGFLMTRTDPTQKCTFSPHSGPVGCLPAPNSFHLANEFAKGKMFCNFWFNLKSRIFLTF